MVKLLLKGFDKVAMSCDLCELVPVLAFLGFLDWG